LPQSLASFSGTGSGVGAGSAAVGAGLGIKALALGSAAIVAVGVTTGEIVTHSGKHPAKAPTPPAQREASPVRQPAVVPTRSLPAASASLVAAVRLGPAAPHTSPSVLRGKRALHPRKHKRVAHPHPKSMPAHVTEARVVTHPAPHGDVGHASNARREHATRQVKPQPAAAHQRKKVTPAAHHDATRPAPKKHLDAEAPSSATSKPDPGPPATVPADSALRSDQVDETGNPADTSTGPPHPQQHVKEQKQSK
jgi:hypothetical protein